MRVCVREREREREHPSHTHSHGTSNINNQNSAIVVTLVSTAIIPLALKPGQEAADKVFAAKQRNPLDKGKGKAPPAKKKK